MNTGWISEQIDYDGSQLRAGWPAGKLGIDAAGDGAVVVFLGACDVKPEFVVDLEEVESGEPIRAAMMVHFIAEFPESDLEKAVIRQRLLAAIVRDELAGLAPGRTFRRRGDDVYENGHKVSVSVATLSPGSSLMHFAVNVDASGSPVPARGLDDFAIDPERFARTVLETFIEEIASARTATEKVRRLT
ncbi:MAG: DUF366 family protein [Planctomycetota bacterium]